MMNHLFCLVSNTCMWQITSIFQFSETNIYGQCYFIHVILFFVINIYVIQINKMELDS